MNLHKLTSERLRQRSEVQRRFHTNMIFQRTINRPIRLYNYQSSMSVLQTVLRQYQIRWIDSVYEHLKHFSKAFNKSTLKFQNVLWRIFWVTPVVFRSKTVTGFRCNWPSAAFEKCNISVNFLKVNGPFLSVNWQHVMTKPVFFQIRLRAIFFNVPIQSEQCLVNKTFICLFFSHSILTRSCELWFQAMSLIEVDEFFNSSRTNVTFRWESVKSNEPMWSAQNASPGHQKWIPSK